MKRVISVILVFSLLFSFSTLFVNAADIYETFKVEDVFESTHPYLDSYYGRWKYVCPEKTAWGVLVTFSQDTYVEPYLYRVWNDDGTYSYKTGDFIGFYDEAGKWSSYDGDELAGQSLFFSGTTFELILISDESINGYGFKIDKIKYCAGEDVTTVTYHSIFDGVDDYTKAYYIGHEVELEDNFYNGTNPVEVEKSAFIGWATEEGGAVKYNPGQVLPAGTDDLDLWPVYTKVLVAPDEVFDFNNSDYYFDVDGEESYYMSKEDYEMMIENIYKNFSLLPIPNNILAAVLATYPKWNWIGSCYGLSTLVGLQHLGKIDLLSDQGVSCVRELEAEEKLVSKINYYQSQVATSYLTENKAFVPTSPVYSEQLRMLYTTVENGNIALFTFYATEYGETYGHTVLITGCYTDAEGRPVLIAYDSNRPWNYEDGEYDSRFIIDKNFKRISYDGTKLGAINWTDNFEQFDSFAIDGSGETLSWISAFFKMIQNIFQMLKNFFNRIFGR
ncbi:MAG TPA: hypothetical protein GXZ23_00500 [Clostridiales bacterium]|nr:hypothetical protein [Clostridiales bacterium]